MFTWEDAVPKNWRYDLDSMIEKNRREQEFVILKPVGDSKQYDYFNILYEAYQKEITEMFMTMTCEFRTVNIANMTPKKIIFNNPATIVYWQDGTKTVVQAMEGDEFIEEVGFAMAVMRKLYGERSKYMKLVENGYRQPKREEKAEDGGGDDPEPEKDLNLDGQD